MEIKYILKTLCGVFGVVETTAQVSKALRLYEVRDFQIWASANGGQ